MTKEDVEALVLFKEYTMLQLKSYMANHGHSEYEESILNKALDLHRAYTSHKLNQYGKQRDQESSIQS